MSETPSANGAASESHPYLSLITPVFNGQAFIEESVRAMLATLDQIGRPVELIVVCDGCTDGTVAAVEAIDDSRIVSLHYPVNEGKGHAILHGVQAARGRLIGWLDADLDIDAGVVLDLVREFAQAPIDAAIGSKRHVDSRVQYPPIRRVYSWGYQWLVRLLFRVNVRDTQVGAKVFRRELLETVSPLLLVKRYAFDLEVLAVGAEFGFDRIVESPVKLEYRFSGTGINWDAVQRMMLDTLAIAYRIHLRHHYVRRFAALERQRMDAAEAGRYGEAAEPAPAKSEAPSVG